MDPSPLNPGKKFAATFARRAERRDKDAEVAGAESSAEIRTLLEGWTSSKVGTVPLSSPYLNNRSTDYDASASPRYERNAVEWLQRSVNINAGDPMMLPDEQRYPEYYY
jgi:hypothetical protein